MITHDALALGLDLGTSSVKALVVDARLEVLACETATYAVVAPSPGRAETPPEAWWEAVVRAVRALPRELRRRVAAVGPAGQMHGVVLAGPDGEALRPAILWSDTRSAEVLSAYRRLDPRALARLANPVVAGMAGPTLVWLLRHEPDVLARARWALQPKDWLRLRLTGEAAADPSDASATLLYDIVDDGWAEDVAVALGLRSELLPPILPSDTVAGTLLPGAARELGLPPGIPVATGAADTAAAAYGGGLLASGDGQLNLGSGAQIVVVTEPGAAADRPRTHLFRSALPGQHYRMAAMQNAGLALEWVRGMLGMTWDELYAGFGPDRVDPELVFLPYLTGERTPLMDPSARAAWVGLGLHHVREDLATGALMGVALSILDGYRALVEEGAAPARLRLSGGGARSAGFSQLLCDLLALPLTPVASTHATAVGAAALALGAATGTRVRPAPAEGPRLRPQLPDANVAAAAARFAEVRRRLLPRAES